MTFPGSSSKSLWRERTFLLFWSGRTISWLGTTITSVVLPLLVYRLTSSALLTSLLGALQVIPYLVFGLFAGALADRVDRKPLMVICDLANVALLGSIPLVAAFHHLTIAQIYAVSLLSAVAFVWFDAANFGAIPAVVGRERVVSAISYLTAAEDLVLIVGPSLAGLLAAVLSPAFAISFDALSYALSAISLLLIPRAFNTSRVQESGQKPSMRQTFRDIRDGLRFLVRQPLARTMTVLGFGNSLTGGAVLSLLVVYGVRGLGLPKNDARIGLLFTAGAIGSLLASLSLPVLVKRIPIGWITLGGLCLTPVLLIGLGITSTFTPALLLYGGWNACYSLTISNGIALRQMVTPDHLQSRVNATARMIAWGGTPFGAAIGGVLASWTTIGHTYLLMALAVGISAIVGWFSPLRSAREPRVEPVIP